MKWYKFVFPIIGLAIFACVSVYIAIEKESESLLLAQRAIDDRIAVASVNEFYPVPINFVINDTFIKHMQLAATRTLDRDSTLKWAYARKDFCDNYKGKVSDLPLVDLAVSRLPEAANTWYKLQLQDKRSSILELCRNAESLSTDFKGTAFLTSQSVIFDQLNDAGIKPIAIAVVPNMR